jgi:small subunit ribosomal protein S4
MRYTGPKNRISRRENTDLGLKTEGSKSHASLLKKINILPGQHGMKRRRKMSERGRQLREKQKLRYMFVLSEKQMKNYFKKAIRSTENTANVMTQLIEQRLDNVIYRLGLVATRNAARQLVSHKHIQVNGKIINIPSYQVRKGDVIQFAREKTKEIPSVESALKLKDTQVPQWLQKQNLVGQIVEEPSSEELEKLINMRLVIEYYSK